MQGHQDAHAAAAPFRGRRVSPAESGGAPASIRQSFPDARGVPGRMPALLRFLTMLSGWVFLVLAPALARAEEDPEKPAVRGSVIVSASVAPEALGETARECVVLEGDRLRGLPVRTLGDVLALAAPVDLQPRTPGGLQADIRIRGSSFSGVLVCVDGVRWSDPQTAHFNLELPVPWERVERVEILTGSQSVFFGSEAMGGVVNLVTRKPEDREFAAAAGVGSFGTAEASGLAGGRSGKAAGELFADFSRSDGFTADRDYRYGRLYGRADLDTAVADIRLTGGYLDHRFGAAGFYGPYPSFEATRTGALALSARLKTGWCEERRTTVDLAWRRHDDDFVLFRDHPELYRNTHATDVVLGKLSTFLAKGRRASLAALGEVSAEGIRSSRLGGHSRQRTALAVDSHWGPSDRFSLQAGLRWDWYSPYGSAWSPGAGAAFFATRRLKLRASAGKAFRVPSFTELYYWSPALRGNPRLRPESAWNVEGGVDWYASETFTLSATVFRRWERDLIDYVRAADTDPWAAANIRRAVVDGVSLQLDLRPAAWVRALAGYAWTDFDLAPSPLQTRYAADFARHVLTLAADFLPGRPLRPGVTVRYKHRALTGEGYVVLSAALAYSRGPWELEARVDNATDATYEELSGVAMPGRGFFATLRYRAK